MHRNTPNNETVIVEYRFLDSKVDDVFQLKNNWHQLTEGVVKILAKYIDVTYTKKIEEDYYIVKYGDTFGMTVIPIYHPSPISPKSYTGNVDLFKELKDMI